MWVDMILSIPSTLIWYQAAYPLIIILIVEHQKSVADLSVGPSQSLHFASGPPPQSGGAHLPNHNSVLQSIISRGVEESAGGDVEAGDSVPHLATKDAEKVCSLAVSLCLDSNLSTRFKVDHWTRSSLCYEYLIHYQYMLVDGHVKKILVNDKISQISSCFQQVDMTIKFPDPVFE